MGGTSPKDAEGAGQSHGDTAPCHIGQVISLAEATQLVHTRGSANLPGPAQTKPAHTVGGGKVPIVHTGSWLGKAVWAAPPLGTSKPICEIVLAQGPGCTRRVMWKDGRSGVYLKEI